MENEGPFLESLTRRLAETPAEFLAQPGEGAGRVDVAAVVWDLLRELGGEPQSADVAPFRTARKGKRDDREPARAVLVAAWLLHDPWFRTRKLDHDAVLAFLRDTMPEVAKLVAAEALVSDPDRREELARLALSALGYRPADETRDQAADRLQTLSSVERRRVLEASRAAEERARQVREAMARVAAQEAAANYAEQ
jgi:hypothetical protein